MGEIASDYRARPIIGELLYGVNRWKELNETWHVGGVIIIEVPFCGLKGIRKRTTEI